MFVIRRKATNINDKMKKLLLMFALIGLVACSGKSENVAEEKVPETDRVEVIYFHGKQRCATCVAIEENARGIVETEFADELKNGAVVFKTVDIATAEGEKIADEYEVSWSSLYVNEWKDGKEKRNNLTEFGFGNARSNPDVFKKGLADKIRQSLK